MKIPALIVTSVLVALTCVLVFTSFAQISARNQPSWNLQVTLVDGSRIIGVPAKKTLQVDVGFGELGIPLERIRRADLKNGGRTIRIELTNEDIITGTIKPEPFEIETIFGKVTLPVKHFKAFEVRPKNLLGWLPTTRGLVLYYSFDRVGDGVVTNLVGDNHIGKLHGSKWTKDGHRGGAMEFNRSGRIEIPHDPELCPGTVTLAAWLKPHGDQSSYQVIVGKTAASSWHSGYAFVRMPGNDNMIHFFVNGYTESVARTEVPAEGWSHVAGVCDGRNVTIYLNGKAMHTVPMRITSTPAPGDEMELDSAGSVAAAEQTIRHSDVPLIIGSDARGYAWNGTIDELVLYRRALSATEVHRLYDATSGQR